MLEAFGWIGGFLLATCGVPMAVQTHIQGHSEGISSWFLWMWFFGEVFVLIYVFPQMLYPLIANYGLNIILVLIVIKYKYYPRKDLTFPKK